jgi:type I restriction enzyme M protein
MIKNGKAVMEDKSFQRDEFSRILTKCHNTIRNNDKLSPEAAFDEISKVLFIKIWKEKKTGTTYTLEQFDLERTVSKVSNQYYQLLFCDTRNHYLSDNIFEKNECLNIRENSFRDILGALSKLNLASASDDVRGIAFEQFLGKTFRGELGQFFTPRKIVEFMVSVLDPQEGDLICDPCCGSGGFLIHAFEYVRDAIMNDNKGNKEARVKKLATKCVFGVDANPRMARTAKMNMMMHGDGHSGVHHHDGFLNVNGIFEDRFQVILTNPPFGSKVSKKLLIAESDRFMDTAKIKEYTKVYGDRYKKAMGQIDGNIGKPLLNLFGISKYSNLTETLFIDRGLDLLVPGGRMGVVLPEGVLNNKKLEDVRHYVEGRAKILMVVSLPTDVFMAAGANVKPSILFLKKFSESEAAEYWRTLTAVKNQVKVVCQTEIDELNTRIKAEADSEKKKKLRAKLRKLNEQIKEEINKQLKESLDYEVLMASVDKAGINSVGAECENELVDLLEEIKKYKVHHQLW